MSINWLKTKTVFNYIILKWQGGIFSILICRGRRHYCQWVTCCLMLSYVTPGEGTFFRRSISLLLSPTSSVMWMGYAVFFSSLALIRSPRYGPSSALPPRLIGGECMGRTAAPCSGSSRIVSIRTAVPCLPHEPHSEADQRMSDQGKGSGSTTAGTPAPGSDTYKGWLFKWTNYLKGYQRRWFVLSNGLLSYYR